MVSTGEGDFRILFADASETRRDVIFGEVRTEVLDNSALPSEQYVVAANMTDTIEEDDMCLLEVRVDAAGASANMNNTSVIRIPVRIMNKKTGVVRETYLTAKDFGFLAANVAIGTSWTVTGRYTVKAQEAIKFGHLNRANSLLYAQLNYT